MGNFKLQDGKQIRFWEDKWLGDNTLKEQYLNLYNIVQKKSATVAKNFSTRPLNVSFRRSLVAANLQSWHHLILRLANVHLRERADIFRWSLKHHGLFSAGSMYQAYLDSYIVPYNNYLWKIKIPLKIKVFLWLLYREALLTKDNLVKRNWHGNELCSFCNIHESIQHLFFECVLAKYIWRVIHLVIGLPPPNNSRHMIGGWVYGMNPKDRQIFLIGIGAMLWVIWLSRNDIVFNKASISSSMQVIFQGTYWIRTWPNFQKDQMKNTLQSACRVMESVTMEIFAKHGWWSINRLSF
jgi:hypothetical protein